MYPPLNFVTIFFLSLVKGKVLPMFVKKEGWNPPFQMVQWLCAHTLIFAWNSSTAEKVSKPRGGFTLYLIDLYNVALGKIKHN